jgi:acetaldehyde dehydrogenase (acetylating)
MSLGCGAYAGNITSDNITPLHLINVKRLAYELPREARAGTAGPALAPQLAAFVAERVGRAPAAAGPEAPAPAPPAGATPLPDPVDFVAEDDVRRALREGRVIVVKRGGIVTPSARDLGEGKDVLHFG